MADPTPSSPAAPAPPKSWRLEIAIGHAVQWVTLALALIALLGVAKYLHRYGGEPAGIEHVRVFTGVPQDLRSLRGIFGLVEQDSARAIGQFAVALLLLVPVGRVAACLAIFQRDRDRLHVLLTFIVLAVLLFSLLLER
jgi:uncharacterized membrane protein